MAVDISKTVFSVFLHLFLLLALFFQDFGISISYFLNIYFRMLVENLYFLTVEHYTKFCTQLNYSLMPNFGYIIIY